MRVNMLTGVAGAVGVAAGSVAWGQVSLHSTLNIVNGQTYNRMDFDTKGNPDAAMTVDDVTFASSVIVTDVTLDYLSTSGLAPADGVELHFYASGGGMPGPLVASLHVGISDLSVTNWTDTVFGVGLKGTRVTADNPDFVLAAGTYWVGMVAEDYSGGDTYYSVREYQTLGTSQVFGRDIWGSAHFGGGGSWVQLLSPAPGSMNSMEIRGYVVPGPGASALALAGLGWGVRRKRGEC